MAVVNLWAGALTDTSARANAKTSGGVTSAELLVSVNESMSGATAFGPQAPDAQDVVDISATGLTPGTRYYYAIDEDSTFDAGVDPIGTFITPAVPAGEALSFTIAAGGCAGAATAFPGDGTELDPANVSNHPVFAEIRNRALTDGWIAFVHTGDADYYNLGVDNPATLANYRTAIDDILHQSNQQALYKDVPLVYTWDDHDFDGNDSDGTFAEKLFPQQVYRERVPSYPLAVDGTDPVNNPIYHSFRLGRVLFIVSDLRSSRTPNSEPDTPAKTMMGSAQKQWMSNLLADSDASLLVWVSSVTWITSESSGGGGSADNWAGYATEAAELVGIFEQSGFIDKMMVLSGDSHFLAMDDGTNTPGGVPLFVANHLDSAPGSTAVSWSEGAPFFQKGQYGTVTVDDDGGDVLTVTMRGWQYETGLLREFSFTVGDEPEPEPEPEEPDTGLAPTASAQIRTRLTWLSCNLTDGAVITELPDLQGDEVSRVIGEYTSASLSLPIPAVGGRDLTLAQRAQLAIQSTQPARTMIVPVVNDVPTAGFIPLTRDLGTDAAVALGCVSLEGYLRHRYVRDHNWEGVDPAEIARGVLADAEDIDGNGQGLNIIVDAPDVGLNAARHFEAIDDVDVYSALAELMDAGLIEWTVDVDWAEDMAYRVVDKIARVRLRLGRSGDPQAVFQSATFSSQGASDARYTLKAEHSGDRYGNSVIARGTGEGEDKPRSVAVVDQAALDAGAPIWEQRIDPEIYRSPLFTEDEFNAYMQEQLGVHAAEELARIRGGGQSLEITARWDAPGARYGVDWALGDDVRHELKGHAHPSGLNGVRRAIGFALSIQSGTIQPILQEES